MLGVDRLDMIKGIPQKLLAFEKFLEEHPEWRDKVLLVQIAVPSRTDVPEYQVGPPKKAQWQPCWHSLKSQIAVLSCTGTPQARDEQSPSRHYLVCWVLLPWLWVRCFSVSSSYSAAA